MHARQNRAIMDSSCRRFEIQYVGASAVILFSCGARAFFMLAEDLSPEWFPFVDSDVYVEPFVSSFPPSPPSLNIGPPPCPHQPDFYTSISQWCLKFCSPLKLPYWLMVRGFPDRSRPSVQWTASARRIQGFISTCDPTAAADPAQIPPSSDMFSQRLSKIFFPQLVGESSTPEGSNFRITPGPHLDDCGAEAQDESIPLSTMSAPEGFRDFGLEDSGMSNIGGKAKVAGKAKRKSRRGPQDGNKKRKCTNAMEISHIIADEIRDLPDGSG